MIKIPRWLGLACVALSATSLGIVIFVPVAALLREAASQEVSLLDPVILAIAKMTALQALLSTLWATLLGLPLGLWASRYWNTSRGSWLRALLAVPFGVPGIVAAIAWVAWLGSSGWGIAYSFKAVILAHVFFNAPLIALWVAEAASTVPSSQTEALRTLGGGEGARFIHLVWPVIRAPLLAAASQVMSLCALSFALVMILGGGPPVQTLETALYSRIRYGMLDMGGAVACALWELLIALTPWCLALAFSGRRVRARPDRSRAGGSGSRGAFVLCFLACLLWLLPYLRVFGGGDWGGGNWSWDHETWIAFRQASRVTLEIALLSSAAAVAVALLGAIALSFLGSRGRWLSTLFVLPSGISVLVLGLGAWLAYGRWLDPFEGSLVWIVALQAAIFMPTAFRIFWPLTDQVRKELVEAAVTLGASPVRAFLTVEGRRWRRAIEVAGSLGAAAAVGEFAAVSFFYNEKLVPLSLWIARLKTQYRFGEAQAAAGVLFFMALALAMAAPLLGEMHAEFRSNR